MKTICEEDSRNLTSGLAQHLYTYFTSEYCHMVGETIMDKLNNIEGSVILPEVLRLKREIHQQIEKNTEK